MPDPLRLSDEECFALLLRLFPTGFTDPALHSELAPDGWLTCPLRLALHPSPAAADTFVWNDPACRSPDTPRSDVEELADLAGRAAWDIFSDNHTVLSPDGREADLGSFRSSSSFLDEFHAHASNKQTPDFIDNDRAFYGGSMTYYMGLSLLGHRADFTPLYRALFARLLRLGCDWRYEFPRFHVIRPQDLIGCEAPAAPHAYDPSAAFAAEQKRAEDDAEFARLQASLAESAAQARAEARAQPPPAIVRAYHQVYARWPDGWPP